MALFCEYGCRVRDRKGCPKHPMAQIERVLPLDGFVWCGEQEERPFERGKKRAALVPEHAHSALCIGGIDWPDCLAPDSTSTLETIAHAPEVKGELNSELKCPECGGSGKICGCGRRVHGGRKGRACSWDGLTEWCPACQKGKVDD